MTRREAQQFHNAATTQARPDGNDVPVGRPGLLKRFYDWMLDEIAPPANEPFEDWADRQW
jgi:hypothetical protein